MLLQQIRYFELDGPFWNPESGPDRCRRIDLLIHKFRFQILAFLEISNAIPMVLILLMQQNQCANLALILSFVILFLKPNMVQELNTSLHLLHPEPNAQIKADSEKLPGKVNFC